MKASDLPDPPLPQGLLQERGDARLHIGGGVRKEGWQVFNIEPGPHVDHVGDVRDLSRFEADSFDMVYASHVLEHVGHGELPKVLQAIARLLRPGGRLFVGVPDLYALCYLFAHTNIEQRERFDLMRIMYGGQINQFDYHQVGLWDWYLYTLLHSAGFAEQVYRVPSFRMFEDASELMAGDVPLSLNVVALKAPAK